MSIQQSTFNRLVQVAKSNLSEGKSIVIPALVSLIMEYKLCDNSNAQTLAVAVWNEASK
jgi:hypothetical protein